MRRTCGSSQRSTSGLLPIPISLNAVLGQQPPTIEQPLDAPGAPDDRDVIVQPKAKVPAFSTPKVKVQCLPDQVSEARKQPTVGNHGISRVQMSEEAAALTNRPSFSTPLVKACFPLENCTRFSSLPGTISSPSGDPLGGGKHQLAESNNKDEQHQFRYFNCVWCKRSGRKHKKWEGDAVLRVATSSATLIDDAGRELARATGYRKHQLEEVEEGGSLVVGAKEVEVTSESSEKEWEELVSRARQEAREEKAAKAEGKGKKVDVSLPLWLESAANQTSSAPGAAAGDQTKIHFKVPNLLGTCVPNFKSHNVASGKPMFDPQKEGALVMPKPPPGHLLRRDESRLVDVVIDPLLSNQLRSHQKQGLVFLYQKVLGFTKVKTGKREVVVEGAILADEMGLGKSLQTVALVWTMLRQSPISGTQLARKVLLVAPSSLLKNWQKEFRKWLGPERISIHIADTSAKVTQFRSYSAAPILLVSYEMMVRTLEDLKKVMWDLVVCDEAHRLKNNDTKAAGSLAKIPCRRRVLLTGTPVQNDLGEFYSLVEAVCPGLLGSRQSFHKSVEIPVELGRQPSASEEEKKRGRDVMEALELATKQIVLRRTQEVINKFLPPKTVNVVFCRPSSSQSELYRREVSALLPTVLSDPGQHLAAISRLRKLCNGPSLLQDVGFRGHAISWEEQAGKLATLTCLLLGLVADGTGEKMVLVSLHTSTLDLLASLCDRHSVSWLRLDGSTQPSLRQGLVDRFNSADSEARVFLLSSKAGGTGLNLIGASRLVLYDLDWNPATDLQAMARIWRDGQKKHCRIYRLITVGTIEEKMYQRQVMKSGLSVGEGEVASGHFSKEELRDLFSFREDTECETHDLLQCSCEGGGEPQKLEQVEEVRSCQLGRSTERRGVGGGRMEQLMGWRHWKLPHEDYSADGFLATASPFITYLFTHTEKGGVKG